MRKKTSFKGAWNDKERRSNLMKTSIKCWFSVTGGMTSQKEDMETALEISHELSFLNHIEKQFMVDMSKAYVTILIRSSFQILTLNLLPNGPPIYYEISLFIMNKRNKT